MTLTLSPEIEKALTAAAVNTGRKPEELAEETLREKYVPLAESAEDRRRRVYALMGSSSHLGPSRIAEDRAEEIAREDRVLEDRRLSP